ncbi:ABC transporter substrate-binding protein [Jeotgalibaca sp. MA1X17-3]|uniref:ABC transporter substrate-binding protein n=1 Tax=Jeotgalibaca sp. MA1X17-3 TaxID=2908211 RepID=UPI001F2A4BAD|nr:ABC transporter substrate-binding protein [Jeotgalibaca sp. MA1X17-3]UJF16401.1 ABC transporter substrate-binding protein [Jeotgalibaca sp. MA1X17-3]
MNIQKIKRAGLALGATVLLAACGGNGAGDSASDVSNASSTTSSTAQENGTTDKETINIGILQYLEHDSLSASRKGFIDVLEEAGYKEGENLNIDYQNAQGDQANLQTMSERISGTSDLLLAIATPSAQSIANVERDLPVLFTAITDPVDAGLVDSLEVPGGNITGTTDAGPIEDQVKLLLSIVDDAKTIGIIYNSSEPNSVIQSDQAEAILKESGIDVKILTVNSSNDVQQVMESLAQDVDGVYIPTDNTLASTMATVSQVAIAYELPVVAASTDQVLAGGLATYGIDYYELGRQTGEMALEILENGDEPATMAVQSSTAVELVVNEEMADALGIDPASIVVPE